MNDHSTVIVEAHDSQMESEVLAMEKAKQVGDTLNQHYPNHLWAVAWQGGVLVVKNLAISSHYGFQINYSESFSASDLARIAVVAGGELLERAGMKRGAWNGQMATTLEGSDPRFFKPTEGY